MFNDGKNNSSSDSLSSVDSKLSFGDGKNSQPQNISIHTMKKDLQNINNPQYFDTPDNIAAPSEQIQIKSTFPPRTVDSKPRTSPFLSQNTKGGNDTRPAFAPTSNSFSPPPNIPLAPNAPSAPKNPAPVPPIALQNPTPPPTAFPTSSAEKPEKINIAPAPHTPSNWGKLILITTVIFLLFAAGAGGYYYWINKKDVAKTPIEIVPPLPPEPVLALDKPNYLNIDANNGATIILSSALDKYIKEVEKEKPSTPVEFMVVDSLNAPIPFKDFISKSNISLPTSVTDNLKDTFSLFIYLDEDQPRLALAIDSTDLIGANLKEALVKNESSIFKGMEPMYLSIPVIPTEDIFNTSYYGGAEIRFRNFNPVEILSLDYTIFRDKLIIGTSKMTLRSTIDYLTANGKVQGAEDVLEDIPEEELQNGLVQPIHQ